MDDKMLGLKPGAEHIRRGALMGLRLDGHDRLTGDPLQKEILNLLCCGAQTICSVSEHISAGKAMDEAQTSLTLAAFILDFEEYLEP